MDNSANSARPQTAWPCGRLDLFNEIPGTRQSVGNRIKLSPENSTTTDYTTACGGVNSQAQYIVGAFISGIDAFSSCMYSPNRCILKE